MVKMAEIVKVKKPTYPLTFRTFVLHLYLETNQSGHMRKSRRPPLRADVIRSGFPGFVF
jgi:hypothetical protein